MHKNPHQNAGNGIKETLFFKIFLGSMSPDPSRGSRAFGASQANSCPPPPPKISKPVRLCFFLRAKLNYNVAYTVHSLQIASNLSLLTYFIILAVHWIKNLDT